jgi:cytochrome b subunit of formate dehydrogenase
VKHQWIAKLALLIVWPPLALLIAALMTLVLALAWFLIPFGVIKRNEEGVYTMTFPWGD